MSTLLDELNNLDPQKQYSISINKVGSFIFVNKKDLKLENIDEKYQHLLKFNLVKKKEISDQINILIVKGKTSLSVTELVQFQLDLIDYKKSNFEPICVTVAIEKLRKTPASLIVKERKQLKNGGLKPVKFEANSAGKNTAVIGDYFLLRLIVILLSMQGVVIATSLISQGIILPITNYIGDTLPIASLVIRDLIYIYLVLGMIAFLVLSLVFSNIKRNFISAYSLKFYKNMIIKLAEKQK